MTTKFVRRSTRILVVNPNSSAGMTHGVEEAIRRMDLADVSSFLQPSVTLTFYSLLTLRGYSSQPKSTLTRLLPKAQPASTTAMMS